MPKSEREAVLETISKPTDFESYELGRLQIQRKVAESRRQNQAKAEWRKNVSQKKMVKRKASIMLSAASRKGSAVEKLGKMSGAAPTDYKSMIEAVAKFKADFIKNQQRQFQEITSQVYMKWIMIIAVSDTLMSPPLTDLSCQRHFRHPRSAEPSRSAARTPD